MTIQDGWLRILADASKERKIHDYGEGMDSREYFRFLGVRFCWTKLGFLGRFSHWLIALAVLQVDRVTVKTGFKSTGEKFDVDPLHKKSITDPLQWEGQGALWQAIWATPRYLHQCHPGTLSRNVGRKESMFFAFFIDWIVCGCMVHIQHHGDHHEQVPDQQAGVPSDSDLRSCANQLHLW